MTEMSRLMVVSTVEPLAQLARLVGLPDEALADALAAEPEPELGARHARPRR